MTANTKCPGDQTHGNVIAVTGSPRWGWHCPHTGHDGRLNSDPNGSAPRTRAFFTTAEVERGSLVEDLYGAHEADTPRQAAV